MNAETAQRVFPEWSWPLNALHLALEALGARLVPGSTPRKIPPWPADVPSTSLQVTQWVEDAGHYVGVACHAHTSPGRTVASLFSEGGPLLVCLPLLREVRSITFRL